MYRVLVEILTSAYKPFIFLFVCLRHMVRITDVVKEHKDTKMFRQNTLHGRCQVIDTNNTADGNCIRSFSCTRVT